jgi:pimeloyl-ACP methyl ester carboxylesterase
MLDEMNMPVVALIGQSMGGAIAAAFAARCPERVSRLVLVDAFGMSSKVPWRAVRNLTRATPYYVRASLTRRTDHLLRFFEPWGFLDPWGSSRETIERMAAINKPREVEVLWAGTRFLAADFLTQGQRTEFVEGLSRITAPTLVAWGRHDGLLSLENAHEGIARIPGAALEIFEESAHEPMLEQPEAFNKIVRKFLKPWR